MSRSPYRWNDRAALFRDPTTGRFVSRETVRRWIDQNIRTSQQRIQVVTDDVRSGRISLDAWQVAMREEIKRTQLAAEMLARGGRSQMTAADFGRVGQRVRVQYGYLRDFARQLAERSIRTDGTLLNRAKLYAAASRGAFHETERDVLAVAGFTLERNLLAVAEHCAQCVTETRRGFVAIGSLVPIGERTCLVNCRCRIDYA